MRLRVFVGETSALVASDVDEGVVRGVEGLLRAKEEVEEYALKHPKFRLSLTPVEAGGHAPETVKRMLEASRLAGVGPMAAVAGAIADVAREEMEKTGARVCLVENGGEVSLVNRGEKPLFIGLFASPSWSLPFGLGFKIPPSSRPLGVSTSSATFGRGLSFGVADAVTVFATSSSVADALSTRVCNETRRGDGELKALISRFLGFKGVLGILAVKGRRVFLAGYIPELVKVDRKSLLPEVVQV